MTNNGQHRSIATHRDRQCEPYIVDLNSPRSAHSCSGFTAEHQPPVPSTELRQPPEFLNMISIVGKGREEGASAEGWDATEEEARAIFDAMDADESGKLDINEMRHKLTDLGMQEDVISRLFSDIDKNKNGRISFKEWLRSYVPSFKVSVTQVMQELETQAKERATRAAEIERDARVIAEGVDWSDLRVEKRVFEIQDTAHRAISLKQMQMLFDHTQRRISIGEEWIVWKEENPEFKITRLGHVTLYDLNKYVILPITVESKLSLVEVMATGTQAPDYFVSHWWGEPIEQFGRCLQRHSADRGLESSKGFFNGTEEDPHPLYLGGRSPWYWVCAHANR